VPRNWPQIRQVLHCAIPWPFGRAGEMCKVPQNNLTLAISEFAMADLKNTNILVGTEKSGGPPPQPKTLAR